jgi:predicted nucleic acid-binding protein
VRYLLDTNVISEWTESTPDARVVAWLESVDETSLYLSVLAFAEVRLGIERLPIGAKRERLTVWLDQELGERFAGRIIAIDRGIAEGWAVLVARGRATAPLRPSSTPFWPPSRWFMA